VLIAFGVLGTLFTYPILTALGSVTTWWGAFGLIMVALVIVSFYTSINAVVKAELFPTEIRAVAVGIGTSLSRIGAAVGTYLVPFSLQSVGIGHTMYVAAAVTLVGLAAAWAMAPETRSLSLRDAAALSH
ncbi:MFS transporter, partial [Pseudomonas sp.]|uniref:MFS transporter n=1 Tax=Pseudomonas sp. TaxID=306 RepID=UPI0025844F18